MTAPEPQPDGLKARARLILEGARCFANAVGISKEIGDGHDDMMAFLQEVATAPPGRRVPELKRARRGGKSSTSPDHN
jgi:hypothetical protein